MSAEKDMLGKELLETLDATFGSIKAGLAQARGSLYAEALAKLEAAYKAWKNAK
jgi:hypothetical protein